MAIAAAAALVVAGVAAIAVNRGDSDDLASTPTDPDATATVPTIREVTSDGPVDWYVLASQDLIAGDLQSEQCCPPTPAPGPTTVMAWGATTGLQDGLLVLVSKPRLDGSDPELTYLSNGFSAERATELEGKVVPGSGLPYVLPDDGVQLLGSGFDGIGTRLSQTYTNDNTNDSGGAVITVGDYRGQLSPLVEHGFHTVDMPALGVTGYRADIDGNVYVVWQAPNGQWATLEIFPGLADRADGIIAAVIPSFAPTITGTPAVEQPPPDIDLRPTARPPPTNVSLVNVTTVAGGPLPDYDSNATVDPAVGMTAPSFGGIDGSANSAVMPGRSPLLVMITAPWCPHCRKALPTVIAADNDGLLGDHALVIVETAPSAGSAVLSTARRLRRMGIRRTSSGSTPTMATADPATWPRPTAPPAFRTSCSSTPTAKWCAGPPAR